MAIYSDKNLYPGINAHVNGYCQQNSSSWQVFHTDHIGDISKSIDALLPAGYLALSEQSLQITGLAPDTGSPTRSSTRPDVTIMREPGESSGGIAATSEATAIVTTYTLDEILRDPAEDNPGSVVIYQAGEGSPLGRPVTRLELLSPSNKSGGRHHQQYEARRRQTLEKGLRLVEIDYLHQSPPIAPPIPDYSAGDPEAYPYTILVSDPRPTMAQGAAQLYAWGVLEPLPKIVIPLAGADFVVVDFNAIYHATLQDHRFYRVISDYSVDPPGMERFREDDRAQLRATLAQLRNEQTSG